MNNAQKARENEMREMAPVPESDPLMVAWNAYKAGDSYANTKHWATKPEHTDGSLWAAFSAGFKASASAQPVAGSGEVSLNWNDHLREHNALGYQHDFRLFEVVEAYVAKFTTPAPAWTEAQVEAVARPVAKVSHDVLNRVAWLYPAPYEYPAEGTYLYTHPTPQAGAVTEAKYAELLYAVSNAYPGESRHETALRYIRQAESQDHGPAKSALAATNASGDTGRADGGKV